MPSSPLTRRVARASERFPVLRGVPVLRLLVAGEVLLLAREHVARLEPEERRRVVDLVRLGRGRTRNLTHAEREELAALIGKAQPREFLGSAAARLSPVPLPQRLVHGRSNR